KKINRHSYDTWLKPTRFSHSDDHTLFVQVPNKEFGEMAERYVDLVLEAIDVLGLEFQDVEFVTGVAQPPPVSSAPASTPVRHDGGFSPPAVTTAPLAAPNKVQQQRF